MTNAILRFDGIPRIEGEAETGGDYVRFRTAHAVDMHELGRLDRGNIEIDGKSEQVVIKSMQVHKNDPARTDGAEEVTITLQRFAPSAS